MQVGLRTVNFELEEAIEVPNGELSCICLPLVYACPNEWVETGPPGRASTDKTEEPIYGDWSILGSVLLQSRFSGSLKALSIAPAL